MNTVTRMASAEPALFDLWKVRGVYVVRLDDGTWTTLTSNEMLKVAELRKVLLKRAHFLLPWTKRELDAFVNRHLYQKRQIIDEFPSAAQFVPLLNSIAFGGDRAFFATAALTDWLIESWGATRGFEPDMVRAYIKNISAKSYLRSACLPIGNGVRVLGAPQVVLDALPAAGHLVERDEDGDVRRIATRGASINSADCDNWSGF